MRRPPRATRTDPLIPPRRSSDLPWPRHPAAGAERGQDAERVADPHVPGPAARHLPRPRHHGEGARPEPAGRRPARFAGPAPQAPRLGRATMSLLSVRGLSVSLDTQEGPLAILQDVYFDLAAGGRPGLVGGSGDGRGAR